MQGRIAVVHLIRHANGPEAARTFFDSYRRCPAGAAHDLVLLCKGFPTESAFDEYTPLVGSTPHRKLFVSDEGFDIGAYRVALRKTEYETYCFLNSFSVLLAPDWLAKLHDCLQQPNVGLVGATGSYESTLENLRAEIRSIRGWFRRRRLRALVRSVGMWIDYPPFPNPTIRTNAFLARRDLLLQSFPEQVRTKDDALRFESGRRSLTRRTQSLGLQTLVVGRDGRGYTPEQWPLSRTFRLQDQSNLLVADNQTERYAHAPEAERRWLASLAWG